MKKYSFLYIFIFLLIFSCSKEDKYSDSNIASKLNIRNEKNDVMNDLSTFSKALSRGLILNSDLRAFIKNNSVDNKDKGFKELLLNCIKLEDIGKGTTFEEALDSLVRLYSNGRGSNLVLSNILSQIPTLCISIPDKFTKIDWHIDELGKTPAVVYYTPDTIINYNGTNIQSDYFTKEKTIYYLDLKPAEGYLEVDLTTGKLNNGELNINDFIGDLSDSCKQEVYIYLNTIIDNCKKYNSKVIFEVDSLYNIINGCMKIKDVDDVTTDPPPFCLTTPIRDVDDQHYTYNYWEGLEFQSIDAIDVVNNQPGGEKYFNFGYFWANAKDGYQQSHKRFYNIKALDLYDPPTYQWVYDLSYCDDDEILSGNAYFCGYLEQIDPGKLKHYSFSDNSGKWFFSKSDYRWYLNDVGKFFNLEIVEVDPTTTTSSSGSSSTYTASISISVPLFEKAGGSVGWTYKNSVTVSSSTSFSGASIVTIGQDPIDWCDQEEQYLDYPWGNLIYVRTGVDVLEY